MASVRPCVGLTLPVDSGIQSIWFLKTAVCNSPTSQVTKLKKMQLRFKVGKRGEKPVAMTRRTARITYQIAMLLRRNPNMPIAPSAQLAQFLYLLMLVLYVILDRQAGRIIDSDITAKSEENARSFKGCEA